MKKKWIFCICTCLLLFVLGGCGAKIPDMTEEERKAISEYAANLLLKYDTSRPSRLVEIVEEEPTPEPTQTPEPVGQGKRKPEEPETTETSQQTTIPQKTEVPEVYDSIEDTLLLPEGVTLVYKKYETGNSFVDETDGYQTLESPEGKVLLIIRFDLLNSKDVAQEIDMLQDNIVYKMIVDDKVINAMITMVGNDLTTLIGSLQPEESKEVLMFAEVEEALLQSCKSLKVEFSRQDMEAEIMIK